MAKRYDIEITPLEAISGTPEVLRLPESGPLIVPGGGLLSDAVYACLDGDLLIELADGSRLIVQDYFASANPPPQLRPKQARILVLMLLPLSPALMLQKRLFSPYWCADWPP